MVFSLGGATLSASEFVRYNAIRVTSQFRPRKINFATDGSGSDRRPDRAMIELVNRRLKTIGPVGNRTKCDMFRHRNLSRFIGQYKCENFGPLKSATSRRPNWSVPLKCDFDRIVICCWELARVSGIHQLTSSLHWAFVRFYFVNK